MKVEKDKMCCKNDVIRHYDLLIDDGNDPVHDSEPLRDYMDKWDGQDFINAMQLDKTKNVLEIGVGTGRLAIRVAPLCNEFYGIDISPKTINRAKENLRQYSNVNLICADFLRHDFSEQFNVIYSSLTFMHITEKQRVINKVGEFLNSNGVFVLSIDKNQNSFIDIGNSKVRIYPDSPEKINEYICNSNMVVERQFEKEFSYIFVVKKFNPIK